MEAKTETLTITVGVKLTMTASELDLLDEIADGYNGLASHLLTSPRVKSKWNETQVNAFFRNLGEVVRTARDDATRSAAIMLSDKP